MRGGRKRRIETARSRESTGDVHLSCIIAVNASAAILALETMWGGGRWVLLKSLSDSSSFSSLLPLLFSNFINTHIHKKATLSFSNSGRFISFCLPHTHTTHNPMNSSGRSQLSSFLWTQLFLNKVLMVLTSSSNKPFPPIREDCEAGLWVLQRKRPDSPWLLPTPPPPPFPFFCPHSPNISLSVACGSPVVVFPVSVYPFTVFSFSSR